MIHPSSFRDPHGFVFRRDGVLYRQVATSHAAHYDTFIASGLYDRLASENLLIPHEEVDIALALGPGAHRILRPELVPFVSYPYEWGFRELRDAAVTTLRIQSLALEYGLSLRDATAFNITFHRGRPLLLDTTSFECLREGSPWVAYRQFCQHFLAPLALMSFCDVRLGQLTKSHLDGIPLDLAVELLPTRSTMKPGLAMHLRMHARSQRKHRNDDSPADDQVRMFSRRAFRGLIDSLRRAVEGIPEPSGDSAWRSYYAEANHYVAEAAAAKERIVAGWLDDRRPTSVWDLGANTGRFARLASSRGIPTVAFDLDPGCVDEAYRVAREEGDEHLLPLVLDLTNPSPGIGWASRERDSIQERGPADLVLGLALIHHLAIGSNVPLRMIVALFADFGRSAIIEWVPKDDPKARQLLRNRDDVFGDYTREAFEDAIGLSARIVSTQPVAGSGRILYLVEGRG